MKNLVMGLAIVLMSSSAFAQQSDETEKQKRDEAFAQMDKNKDGVIDRKEFDASLDAIASNLESHFLEAFKDLDTNGDGKLDKDEVKPNAALVSYFDQIDADNDGFLTLDEIKAAISAAQAKDAEP